MYQVRSFSTGKPLNFRLCDTRGLEESQGIDAQDIAHLIDGNVPDGYQVNTVSRSHELKNKKNKVHNESHS